MAVPTQSGIGSVGEVTPTNTEGLSYIPIGGIHLYVGTGTPNSEVTAPKGSIFVEVGVPEMWQNTDGSKTWAQVGLQS